MSGHIKGYVNGVVEGEFTGVIDGEMGAVVRAKDTVENLRIYDTERLEELPQPEGRDSGNNEAGNRSAGSAEGNRKPDEVVTGEKDGMPYAAESGKENRSSEAAKGGEESRKP